MKWLQTSLIGLLALLGSLALTGCYVEHHGYAYGPSGYAYVYYPSVEVYFEPHRHVYWWHDGGYWRSGRYLPRRYVLRESVRVNVDSPEPWRHHAEIRARYPVY